MGHRTREGNLTAVDVAQEVHIWVSPAQDRAGVEPVAAVDADVAEDLALRGEQRLVGQPHLERGLLAGQLENLLVVGDGVYHVADRGPGAGAGRRGTGD